MAGLLGGWQDDDTDFNFVEPDVNKTFAERMAAPFKFDATSDDFKSLAGAAYDQTLTVGMIGADQFAQKQAYDDAIAKVKSLTGATLENPMAAGAYKDQIAEEAKQRGIQPGNAYDIFAHNRPAEIFQEQLARLRKDNRDVGSDLTFSPEAAGRAVALRNDFNLQRVDADTAARVPGPVRAATQFAGGTVGFFRNPVGLSSLAFGGPTLALGRNAVSRTAMAALSQGAFNAGLQALQEPAVQAWRRKIGLESGVQPGLEEIGFAFLTGAIPGAAIHGSSEVYQALRPQIARVMDGTATPAEARQVLEALQPKAAEELHPVISQAEQSDAAGQAALNDAPPDIMPADHDTAVKQAVRAAQDETLPNPEPPTPVRRAPEEDLIADRSPLPATGAHLTVDGKPASFEQFSPNDLTTDASAFQYKGGADAAGVTDRLKGVQTWDPIASSKAMVFERRDGTQIIADGHQRLGLAQRLTTAGKAEKPVLDGFLFKESDGWTPEDVRALAARKNMQEGSGTALDAARVLRDRPDLLDSSLPISSPMMKQAIGLSKLSDDGFGMVVNGAVPENYAAAVGQLAPDPLTHGAILQDLVRASPQTEREARFLISDALAAGFHVEEQINLFGAGEMTRTLLGERASVMSSAIKALNADKRLFGILADRADIIEAAGNQLSRATNADRAQSAAIVGDLVMKLAQRTGPVSDLLNAAARRVAEGDIKPGAAGKEFLDGVRKALDDNGLAGLMAEPKLAPEKPVEPGTQEALGAVESQAAPPPVSPRDLETPDLFDAVPLSDRESGADTVVASAQSALDAADRIGFTADVVSLCTRL